jgi:hypothetical protein
MPTQNLCCKKQHIFVLAVAQCCAIFNTILCFMCTSCAYGSTFLCSGNPSKFKACKQVAFTTSIWKAFLLLAVVFELLVLCSCCSLKSLWRKVSSPKLLSYKNFNFRCFAVWCTSRCSRKIVDLAMGKCNHLCNMNSDALVAASFSDRLASVSFSLILSELRAGFCCQSELGRNFCCRKHGFFSFPQSMGPMRFRVC